MDDGFLEKWDRIHAVRDVVLKALEEARAAKTIGKSLEAKVTLHCHDEELYGFLEQVKEELAPVFIVSQVTLEKGGEGAFQDGNGQISVDVVHASGAHCPRCWAYSDTVGADPKHPDLCARCAEIVG